MMTETFHFLRPEWLLTLLGIPLIWFLAKQRKHSAGAWRRVCDPELLPHLLHTESNVTHRWAIPTLALGWFVAALALAGPTWERLPETAYHEPTQTVAVLQLTPSMGARDTAPSRLDRARYELQDLLSQARGTVGLVIFSEEAYGVTPLTDDPRVISEVVPTLDPTLMPGRGTRTDRGIEEAQQLLENAGARSGRIILLVDGLGDAPDQTLAAAERAARAGYPVSVLSLNADSDTLQPIVDAGQGRLSGVTADDRDVAFLLGVGQAGPEDFQNLHESGLMADTWRDNGVWLLLLPLLLAPLSFRKGWAGSLGLWLLWTAASPQPAQALVEDWFSRPDQQAATAFAAGQHAEAADQFEDPEWRGVAAYRGGDLDESIEILSDIDTPRAEYNLGNALARKGRLEEAVATYDSVLEQQSDHTDARHNRDLVASLLKQQQEQQQQQQQQQQGEGEDSESQSSEGENSESQSQEKNSEQSGSASEGSPQESGNSGASTDASGSENSQATAESDPAGKSDSSPPPDPSQPEMGDQMPQTAAAEQDPAREEANESTTDGPDQAGSGQQLAQTPPNPPGSPNHQPEQMGSEQKDDEAPYPDGHPNKEQWADREAEPASTDANPFGQPEDELEEVAAASAAGAGPKTPMSEEDQEIEQWLSRVPDDPGGLLREKLRRRYAEKRGMNGLRQGGSRW